MGSSPLMSKTYLKSDHSAGADQYSNHERGRSVRCSGTLFIDHVTVTLPHCHTWRDGKVSTACADVLSIDSAATPARSSFFTAISVWLGFVGSGPRHIWM